MRIKGLVALPMRAMIVMIVIAIISMVIQRSSSASLEQRNLGLSSLTGLNPIALLGAVKLANDASKLIPGNTKDIVDTAFGAVKEYSPINIPHPGNNQETIDETIKLDDRQLKLHLPAEKVAHLIKMAGLKSDNIDWKMYRFPCSFGQLKMLLTSRKGHGPGSSSQLSIMSMETYLPKMLSNIDRLSDGYYRLFEKYIETNMDVDELMEYSGQLEEVDEGLLVLPAEIKSGALAKPPGSIVLLALGKFPLDRKQSDPPSIVPIILVGQVSLASPSQYKPEPEPEPVLEPEAAPAPVPESEPIAKEKEKLIEELESEKMLDDAEAKIKDSPFMVSIGHGHSSSGSGVEVEVVSHHHKPHPGPSTHHLQPGQPVTIHVQSSRPVQRPLPSLTPPQVRPNVHPMRPPASQSSYDPRPPQYAQQPRPLPRPRMEG